MRVIVIGGGIAGASAAAHIAPVANVTLLEGESDLGYHASGRSAAMFEENYGSAPVRALSKASKPTHEDVGVLNARGILMVALPDEVDVFLRDLGGMGMAEIDVGEARARIPILHEDIVRAAIHEGASDLDTDNLLQHFVRIARDHSARVVTGKRVSRIEGAGPFCVEANGEIFEADVIVNAAGAWADQIAEMAGVAPQGLTPLRRSVARMQAPGGHDARDWPMIFGPGEDWYAKPDAGAWIVSPAEEDPSEPMDAWADDMVIAEGIARYERHVSLPVTRVETTWAGLRTFAPDRSLVIGQSGGLDGFFWMAGQGGYGFQTAPAAGQLLADLIAGNSPELDAETVAALAPDRFG
ncbi:MAG: FAD-dependent oxidoreductase [Paracoccaceae bacterium]|nr:FAD-dependent oxidoreductase [Paracoccaceae bacterium]